MNTIVIYKSKYGATKKYAEWIAEALSCEMVEAKNVKASDLLKYDTIIYGGGLYAEVINGVTLITKNFDMLKEKKLIVFTTAITPLSYREYYDNYVIKKNFKPEMLDRIKIFNFMGKMLTDELSLVHKTALKSLKKIMMAKENPSELEKLLVNLCDYNNDECDKNSTKDLIDYARG